MRLGHRTTFVAAVLAALTAVPAAVAQDGWINLFDGETLFGLQPIGDAHVGGAGWCPHEHRRQRRLDRHHEPVRGL